MELILEISKSSGPIILAIVAAYLAYRHNKLSRELSNDNLQKQLFTEFNSRYDNMNDIIQFVLDFSKEDSVKFLESKNDEVEETTEGNEESSNQNNNVLADSENYFDTPPLMRDYIVQYQLN